jgi:hypothetical protein
VDPSHGGGDDLSTWVAARAPALLARAEAEAVAVLRDALVAAATAGADVCAPAATAGEDAPILAAARDHERPGAVEPATTPPDPTETGELLWVYCVLRDTDPYPEGLLGVDARGEVEAVRGAGLVALVSRVPRNEFGAEPLRRNLNELAWLESVARAHEAVLAATLQESTLVPLRMCTLYETAESVRGMLGDRRESLVAALDVLAGRYEWAVKVLVDRERITQAAGVTADAGDPGQERSGQGEGGAYLLRRRADRAVRQAADSLRAEVAERVHARLQDWAIDAITRPPQNPELSGHEGDMVLNGAYLVERERSDELRGLVTELEDHHRQLGVRIELTGPWPPYNFVPRGD